MEQKILNEEQEQIILGSLLGDGSILNKRGTYEFRVSHDKKQKEYLYWKNNFLKFPSYEYKNNPQVIISKTNKEFERFFDLFPDNKENIKIDEILNKLSPLGIAIWFIDDGNFNYGSNSLNIATCYFTKSQNEKIIKWFKEKNINFQLKTINTKGFTNKQVKKYFILSTDKANAIKFLRLIQPITKTMPKIIQYKLGKDDNRRLRIRDSKNKYQKKYYEKEIKNGA